MSKSKLPTGITKRGSSYRWSCMVDGIRRSGSSPDLEGAVAARSAAIQKLKHGGTSDAPSVSQADSWTMQKAVDMTFSLPAPEGWHGIKHPEQVRKLANQIIEFFGPDTKLATITKGDADAFVAQMMSRGNANSTINQKICTLSKVLKVAQRNGGLASVPTLPRRLKLNNSRIRQLSKEEEATMLNLMRQMGKEDHAQAVECLIDIGCRNSELWALEARDLDFKVGLVFIYGMDGNGTKNGSYRSVPMSDRVKVILKQRADQLSRPTDKLFPFDNWWMRSVWDRTRMMMGLDEDKQFVPYVCRHTCASRLVRAGVPIPVVKDWLGHKTIQMTMRYAHLMPTDLLAHVGALNSYNNAPMAAVAE